MQKNSVHLMDFPDTGKFPDDKNLIASMDKVRAICSSALFLRDKFNLRVRLPLNEIKIIGKNLNDIKGFEDIILDELNIKKLTIENDINKKAEKKLQLNFAKIGAEFGAKIPEIMKSSKTNNYKIIDNILSIAGLELNKDYFTIKLIPLNQENSAIVEEYNILIELDRNITKELEDEGLARDLIRIIQQNRKDADLNISDILNLKIIVNNENLISAIKANADYIKEQTLTNKLEILETNNDTKFKFKFENKIDGEKIEINFECI